MCVYMYLCLRARCLLLELLVLQSDTISGASRIGVRMHVRRCRQTVCAESVCPWSAAFSISSGLLNTQSLAELSVCSPPVCTSVCVACLLPGCLPIEALVRLSVCRPTCSSALRPFKPMCLRLLLTGDKLASWQPEAICQPPALSALLCLCQSSAAGLSHSGSSHGVHTLPPIQNREIKR